MTIFRLFLCLLGQFFVWIHSVKFGEDSSLEPRAGRLSSLSGDGDGDGDEHYDEDEDSVDD